MINVEVVAGVLLARWLLGEPLTAQRLTGAAVTLAGVLYLTGDAARLTTVFGPTTVQGNLTVMAAALAWSVYAVAQRRAPRGENLFRLLTPIFAVALLTTLPAAARPAAWEGAGGVAASGALLALTLLCTVGVYVVYGRSQDCLPMTVLTVVLATVPVFAVVFAWLLGGERLTARVLVGGAIVLAGVLVVAAEPTRALAEQLEDRDGAGEALQLRRP